MRRERERNGRRGRDIGITAMFLRSAKTWWDCYYQSPRLRYGAVSRQPSYPIKVYWICRSRNFWKAAVASPSYMSSVAKVRFFLHIPTLFWKYLKDSSEIICLRVQHLFVSYKENIRKGITLNPQLVAASQLVGNVGISIILTVFWKLDIKWLGHKWYLSLYINKFFIAKTFNT